MAASHIDDLAGVVLAAGRGSRMSPLTDRVPKPLLTVGNERLLDLALQRVRLLIGGPPVGDREDQVDRVDHVGGDLAVNAHYLAAKVALAAAAFEPSVHVSLERRTALGTAGALRHLRDWIDGRPVLLSNSDLWLAEPIDGFLDGWDGMRPRLLVQELNKPADFGRFRYLGVSTVPAATAAALGYSPSGLYRALWQEAYADGGLEFVEFTGRSFDCGTPAEFLAANLAAAHGESVIAPDALVHGTIDRCVVLEGALVAPEEHLVCAIRDRFGHTVTVDPAQVQVQVQVRPVARSSSSSALTKSSPSVPPAPEPAL